MFVIIMRSFCMPKHAREAAGGKFSVYQSMQEKLSVGGRFSVCRIGALREEI